MKYFLLLLLLTSFSIKAQDLEKCGLDDNPVLTDVEAKVLNELKRENETFDFTGKKMLIVTGSIGSGIEGKSKFFSDLRRYVNSGYEISNLFELSVLTDEEKIKSNGCDVILLYRGVKWFADSRKRKWIRKMHKKSIIELVAKSNEKPTRI